MSLEHNLSLPKWAVKSLWVACSIVFAAACSEDRAPAPQDKLARATAAQFTNGGFETGTPNVTPPAPWNVDVFLNNGITVATPETYADLMLQPPGNAGNTRDVNTTVVLNSALGPNSVCDPNVGCGIKYPRYGNQCAIVNPNSDTGANHGQQVNDLSQIETVDSGDIDPSDGLLHVRFAMAPVLQNPMHMDYQQPYFFIQLTNVTRGNTVVYNDFNFANQTGVPWLTANVGGVATQYTDWQIVDIQPAAGTVAMGDQVKLDVLAAGCSLGGHFGYVYIDGVGSTIQGIYVSGKAPSQVNACNDLPYTLTYHNGGSTAETNVKVNFTIPAGTTFKSVTPPASGSCTAPAVGATGTVTCTIPTVAAGAFGSFNVTVNVNCATTGTITQGLYSIVSDQEPSISGNKLTTLVGCGKDTDCTGGNWCFESKNQCTSTLANSTPIPTDAPHTGPTLNGTCTAAAGTLVCTSNVCDPTNNECGYKNGDGPCTPATGSALCQSAVCGTDDLCGFPNGEGPCTGGNATTVCRSGACSSNGTCEPLGGCNVDADCNSASWCNETSHTCTAKLTNGTPMPTDGAHTSPTLNGTCTATAATTVCQSGVCDTADNKCGLANSDGPCSSSNGATVCRSSVCDPDLKCGYANGDGPCSMANGSVVCRSGDCSTNGLCAPPGGCNVDSDCTAGNWCNEGTHTCTPKLANGVAIPTDPPHMNPTLNGFCSSAAGTLVCTSGVCDTTNNECGYAVGDGPCTPANGGVVCQSGACSANGTCEPAGGCNVDADCSAGNWCNESSHSCTPQLPNNTPVPNDPPHTNPTVNGTCTAAAGALVCSSGVCDTLDNKCGYANGDGPCTNANGPTVCRSGACSANGTCEPTGGCNVDADCNAGNWCNETSHSCTPQLANGQPIPTDSKHTSPTIDGTCTAGVGAVVCQSGVCDPTDNKCGYANGDGTCTQASGGTVCRSDVCDPDTKCGYANGDGPCTLMSGGIVCRSGLCSNNMLCEPPAGCNVDADCTGGSWCNETMHLCAPKLPNSQAIPTDTPHSNPTLNGTCTTVAATLVCQSGVCDTSNNECGYAIGTGPCTPGNGGVVCQSGVCSSNGTCEPPGGCNADADCTAGDWCNESTHTCTPQLANGQPVPTDNAHSNPTLNGMCTSAAGTLVCQSGVCDTNNNECGLANGSGPCTPANGGVLCQSGVCSSNGTCEPAGGCNVDADCMGGNWCNESTHMCAPKVVNSQPVPTDNAHTNPTLNGMCSMAAGTLTCVSGVCDTNDNLCGYATGDGPCNMMNGGTVCRSGMCNSSGVCSPPSGCNVDADCMTGNWCDEAMHVCTPQLANGKPVPTDAPHANPTLNGTCTMSAGTLVCASSVCDTKDNDCGYANGDGPCTSSNGAVVCRSGICATTGPNQGKCEGCTMDPQCPGAMPHCDMTTNTCVMCTQDSQCGGAMSGKVCGDTTRTCESGCRGMGGNGCPTNEKCTSMDKTIGTCVMSSTTTSSTTAASTSSATSGAGGSTSSTTGAGGGGPNNVFIQGHGIFGCSTSAANDASDGSPALLGGFAMLWIAGRRRRRAARR